MNPRVDAHIMKTITKATLLTCLILALGACTLQNATPTIMPTVAATSAPSEWFMRWFENPACSPPCWETITPGVTSVNDFIRIQRDYPQLHLRANKGVSTVPSIYLSLAYDNVPIKLFIEKYGQPDYVRLYKCDPGVCETHVIYEKLGMVLNLGLPAHDSWTVDISAESNLFELYFQEAGLDKYWYNFPPDPKTIEKWRGYGAYSQ